MGRVRPWGHGEAPGRGVEGRREPPQVRGSNGGAPSRLQKFEDLRLSCSAFILGQDLSKARLSCPTFPPKQSLRPLWVLLEERADALEAG